MALLTNLAGIVERLRLKRRKAVERIIYSGKPQTQVFTLLASGAKTLDQPQSRFGEYCTKLSQI